MLRLRIHHWASPGVLFRTLPPLLLACLLPLLLLAGCDAREPKVATLDFWAMGSEGERVQALLPEFERRHPGIRVRVQQIPWSAAHEKLLTAHVGGALPDVFQLGNTWLPEFVALKALAPLDAVLPAADQADIFPGVLAANRLQGHLYGLPWYVDTRLLFYRADLLQQAGIESAPRSWDDWLAALRAVKRQSGRAPLLLPFAEWQTLIALALQRDAGLLKEDDRYGDFRAPAFREALAFFLQLFGEGLAEVAGEGQTGNIYQAFARGRIAFLVSGPWNLGEFERRMPTGLQGAWATAPLPAPDGSPWPGVSIAGGASLAVRADSRHAEAARALVAFLSAPDRQLAFYRETGDLPVRMSAWTLGGLHEAPRVAAFWQQLQQVRGVPAIPEWERIATLVMRHAERAARGLSSADEALAAIDRETDAMLEKRRWLMDRKQP
ncbi:MAG: extracellular solute-binding protein [Halothiobacillaceae bacterium]|nr:MAG: extracellular solute-binding protein [Halothiobacillaceae bacterium]